MSYSETLDLLKERDLRNFTPWASDSFKFLVKWSECPYTLCTWEDEYFLKDQYDKILQFSARKKIEELQRNSAEKVTVSKVLSKVGVHSLLNHHQKDYSQCQEQIKSLKQLEIEDADYILNVSEGFEAWLIGYLSLSNTASLIACNSQDLNTWASIARLYYPQLDIIVVSSQEFSDNSTRRFEFDCNEPTPSYDLMIVDFEVLISNQPISEGFNWKYFVADIRKHSDRLVEALHTLSQARYRSPSRRIACVDIAQIESQSSQKNLATLLVAALRFVSHPKLSSYLLRSGLFPQASDSTLDFYFSVIKNHNKLLNKLPSDQLATLVSRLRNYPLTISNPSHLTSVIVKDIIVRASDTVKEKLLNLIVEAIPWLSANGDEYSRKKRSGATVQPSPPSKQKLLELVKKVINVENLILSTGRDESKVLDVDGKLKWMSKYLDSLKLEGRAERIVIVFNSLTARLRAVPVLQRISKYVLWQITEGLDSFEVTKRIREFNESGKKTSFLVIDYECLKRVVGIQSCFFIISHENKDGHQSEIETVCRSAVKQSCKEIQLLRICNEGTEEWIKQSGKGLLELGSRDLEKALKFKLNYVLNTSTIFKLDQTESTMRKLLDGNLNIKPSDECIVDKSSNQNLFKPSLLISVRKFDYHFENVVEETNPLNSWKTLKDKYLTHEAILLITKKPLPVALVSKYCKTNDRTSIAVSDNKLETYLQKRFLSPRFDKVEGLPHPNLVHTMDPSKALAFLNFVCSHGLYFENALICHKKFCLSYPEETTSGGAEFENFKSYLKEFIHMMAYRDTRAFQNSPMLCGMPIETVYPRIFGLTTLAKLVVRYQKTPEEFMLNETYKILDKPIVKKLLSAGSGYEYNEKVWNNYDLYCLCNGVWKHGFGEWELILRDENLWEKQMQVHHPEEEDLDADEEQKKKEKVKNDKESLVDVLLHKFSKTAWVKGKSDKTCKKDLLEFFHRKMLNLLQLVFENSKSLSI